ncbi:MAG: GNAT family acetyltransferase [Anaerolineae bacterium]
MTGPSGSSQTATEAGDLHGPVDVRSFEVADEGAVVELWRRCGLVVPWNDPHHDIERKLGVQRELFLVASLDERIVGSVMSGYDGHRGSVNYLAVDPGLQGRGIGRRLMREVEARLLELGCPKINLNVRTSNLAVMAFYESLGYSVDDVACVSRRLVSDIPEDADGA